MQLSGFATAISLLESGAINGRNNAEIWSLDDRARALEYFHNGVAPQKMILQTNSQVGCKPPSSPFEVTV